VTTLVNGGPSGQACANCRYFAAQYEVCKRYPPTWAPKGQSFPEVLPSMWCGEWQQALKPGTAVPDA